MFINERFHIMKKEMLLYLYVFALTTQIKRLHCTRIELSVKENTNIGTVVANIYSYLLPSQNNTKLEQIHNLQGERKYFTLRKSTGDLTVSSPIDRETMCEHTKHEQCLKSLILHCDKDFIYITITIKDVNDNSPVFLSTQNTIQIQENIPIGTSYFLPVAQDKDTTEFGVKNYSISGFRSTDKHNVEKYGSMGRYFQMERSLSPQLQVTGNIDREEVSSFVFLFIASDFGPRSGTCTVTVVVTDVNDNSPEWTKEVYRVKIKECQAQGEILEFNATDRDDPNTANGRISYKFSDRTNDREKISQIFYINGNKLYLSNNRPSELSSSGSITIFVIAVDGNGRMKETTLEIFIEDCNDHPPRIDISKRHGQLSENVKEKLFISMVTVSDKDKGRNGKFECSLNDSRILHLNERHKDSSQNFVIYKIETHGDYAFDREDIAIYSVEIRCEDQGDPPLSSTQRFSINILDQNDNAPKFDDRSHIFRIAENNPIGATIGVVKAIDPDNGINGSVRYSVLGEDHYFTISSNGEIQSKVRFDREERENYEFVVLATDSGMPPLNDTMTVKVAVLDVNDCAPSFNEEYIFKIPECFGQNLKNERIGEVKATDRDFELNGSVSYKLLGIKTGESNDGSRMKQHFQKLIQVSSDGGISISGNLDREKISSLILNVEAHDNGNPRLSATTSVHIEITDINDNAPRFKFPNKSMNSINISFELEIASHVCSVVAEDPDQGNNGTVTYSFVEGGASQFMPFKMEIDGRIIVLTDLKNLHKNRRLPSRLLIRASDMGTPSKSSIATLHIRYYETNLDSNQNVGHKSTELSKLRKNEKNNRDNLSTYSTVPDSMMLLYCLAAILFFVFIIVFSVLLYIYCTKTFSNSERYPKKLYKCNNSYDESDTHFKEFQQVGENPREFNPFDPRKIEDGSGVCFLNDDGSSYTHLMMLNNTKYTPMIHSTVSPNSLIRQGGGVPPDIMSVSQNYLNATANSPFQTTSPQTSKRIFSFSNNGNSPLVSSAQNYSTLHDKLSFNSLNRNKNVRSLSLVDKHNTPGDAKYCQQQKDSNSQYVTSSFV